ncbi:MAG: alpha/beta fold hydrolase [Acidimicrobiales bacterium]
MRAERDVRAVPSVRPVETFPFDTAVGRVTLSRCGVPGGEPVVYLHSAGGEGGADSAAPFLERIGEWADVYAPMLPGFSGSEGLDQIDDMEDAVYHMLDLLERLGLGDGISRGGPGGGSGGTGGGRGGEVTRRPHLVGLSLGGWLAAEIAWRHPGALASMTLVNAPGIYVEGAPMAELFGRPIDELAEDTFADQSHPVAAMMHQLASMGAAGAGAVPFDLVRPYFEAMAAAAKLGWDPYFHNPKMRRRLHRVDVPTLVVAGRLDGLVPNAVAEEYARLIRGARLVYIEDASHMIPLEQPDRLALLVREVVEPVPGRSSA